MSLLPGISLRAYQANDEDASIALWLRAWQATFPEIDFAARLNWWRARWRNELLPVAEVVVAEAKGNMVGFVTIDTATALSRSAGGRAGILGLGSRARAGRPKPSACSPAGVDLDVNVDNERAKAFYGKCGFAITGNGKNPITGRPIHRMSWRP